MLSTFNIFCTVWQRRKYFSRKISFAKKNQILSKWEVNLFLVQKSSISNQFSGRSEIVGWSEKNLFIPRTTHGETRNPQRHRNIIESMVSINRFFLPIEPLPSFFSVKVKCVQMRFRLFAAAPHKDQSLSLSRGSVAAAKGFAHYSFSLCCYKSNNGRSQELCAAKISIWPVCERMVCPLMFKWLSSNPHGSD